jgi:aquaporin NIP
MTSRRAIVVAEIFGTFCLVFVGTGAIIVDVITGKVTHVGVSLVFGLVVMSMIYTVGNVSGAHLNPAVTIAFSLAGRLSIKRIPMYLMAQLVGAVLASLALRMAFGNIADLGATLPAGGAMQSFVLEFLLTLILMVVILCVATGPKEIGVLAGIAIGGVIALEALFAGPICGASMNPVRSLAPAVVSGQTKQLWIYLIAPTLGAAAAVPIWRALRTQSDSIQQAGHS